MSETFEDWIQVRDDNEVRRALLHSDQGLRLFNAAGQQVAHLDRTGGLVLGSGSSGEHGDIFMFDSAGNNTVHISGEDGDVILKNADAAEDFCVCDADNVEPGTVLVIESEHVLRESDTPYDRRVAGVVSGGSTYRPGIVLDRQPGVRDRLPVALAGKVHVKADATDRPIEVGDLLTTSALAGHAMCADDPLRTPGAVIGKALAPLRNSTGLVPILVSLQ